MSKQREHGGRVSSHDGQQLASEYLPRSDVVIGRAGEQVATERVGSHARYRPGVAFVRSQALARLDGPRLSGHVERARYDEIFHVCVVVRGHLRRLRRRL